MSQCYHCYAYRSWLEIIPQIHHQTKNNNNEIDNLFRLRYSVSDDVYVFVSHYMNVFTNYRLLWVIEVISWGKINV